MGKYKNLSGMTFGRLTAIEPAGSNRNGCMRWQCNCACGKSHVAASQSLTNGKVRSCGCLKGDTPAYNRTHNRSGTPLFRVWSSMRNRCENPSVASYPNYGGRGIKVCARWHSFENFLIDMGDRPSDAHTLDRIDNEKGYEPGNVRWATRRAQAVNKRNNRFITSNGETLALAEWARRLGCTSAAILARIAGGMTEPEAVTTPVPERPNSKLTAADARYIRTAAETESQGALARKFEVSKKTIANVINRRTFTDV